MGTSDSSWAGHVERSWNTQTRGTTQSRVALHLYLFVHMTHMLVIQMKSHYVMLGRRALIMMYVTTTSMCH